jgi:SAM-dependent methyltransferase
VRPFYGEFAWAYDRLIERPVESESEALVRSLARRGVRPPAQVLDVGCGTGRYAIELARRGYDVRGIDRSPAMIDEARKLPLSFEVADFLGWRGRDLVDAVLCRGVLNDLIEEQERRAAFAAFARMLRGDGVLILDVREWQATAARKSAEPVFEKTVDTPRGRLTFRSVTELDADTCTLRVQERHVLRSEGQETVATFRFIMKCWSRDEVMGHLSQAGFGAVELEPAADRLAVIARREARIECEP